MPSGGLSSTRVGGRRCGGSTVPSRPFARAHSSMRSSSRPILRSDSAHMLRSEPANCALPSSVMPARRPTSLTPMSVSALRSRVERSGVPASCSEGTRRARADVVHLVVALVEHAGGVHPPFQILAAIDAGRPDVLADRQRHRTPRALDLVRDLGAARRRPHDQDAAVGELARDCDRTERVSVATDGGTRLGKARASAAMLQAPEASTTVRHRQSPRSVRTRYPVRRCAPT